ncbi:MAG: hypothetical protein IJ235_01055 [Eubacterium sp.]|nr:hypothetical protein [Eubacterium sp.]MBQ8980912.1 hypothetical protein [Eubacterium sp.]MBR2279067.1 hypothetical protein [Eubacterium sp.]
MIKIAGVSLAVLFCALIVKDKNRTIAALLSVAGGVLLLSAVIGKFADIIGAVREFSGSSSVTDTYVKLMLKALGITILTQFVADTCRDNGESALASITETASKIAVVAMLLPLFQTIISIVGGLLK